MPVDEIAEVVVRGFGRLLWELFVQLIFEVVCFGMGFGTLRVISLGRYPPMPMTSGQEMFCSFLGLAELIGAAVVAVMYFCY